MTVFIVLMSVFFAAIRLLLHRQVAHGLTWHGTYEAFAHVWVGFLLAVAIFCPQWRMLSWVSLAIISLAVEGVMFFVDNPTYRR